MSLNKIAVRISDDLLNDIVHSMKEIGYTSRNQFILDAIDFYIEQYQITQLKHLPLSIETILSSNLSKLEQNVSSFLFKNAVETAMLTQILATIAEVDPEDLRNLREQTTKLVKHNAGNLNLESMMKQQEKEGD